MGPFKELYEAIQGAFEGISSRYIGPFKELSDLHRVLERVT